MDHVGLAARVKEASGAAVLTGRLDAERMAHAAAHPDEEAEYRAVLLRRCGAPDDDGARGGGAAAERPPVHRDASSSTACWTGTRATSPARRDGGSSWTPGHTAGHVSLFRPADRVLIAGDAVLPRITPTLGVNRQRDGPGGRLRGGAGAAGGAASLPRPSRPRRGAGGRRGAHPRAARGGGRGDGDGARAAGRGAAQLLAGGGRALPGREMPPSTRMLALRETLAHLDRLAAAGRARCEETEGGAARFFLGGGRRPAAGDGRRGRAEMSRIIWVLVFAAGGGADRAAAAGARTPADRVRAEPRLPVGGQEPRATRSSSVLERERRRAPRFPGPGSSTSSWCRAKAPTRRWTRGTSRSFWSPPAAPTRWARRARPAARHGGRHPFQARGDRRPGGRGRRR